VTPVPAPSHAPNVCPSHASVPPPLSLATKMWVDMVRALASLLCVCLLLMILLLLFLQKQSLAFAVYLFWIGTLHTGPGLKKKHM
jgi:hypothetical protein